MQSLNTSGEFYGTSPPSHRSIRPPMVAAERLYQRCRNLASDREDIRREMESSKQSLIDVGLAVNTLLDRVFDEFGLIIAGWSGEYDTALRQAMERCKTRRFGFYWTSLSDPRGAAEKLITLRGGVSLKVAGADEFFAALADKVSILDEMQGDDPVSIATAIALVKRYLGEPRQTIRLAELVATEAAKSQSELKVEQDRLLQSSRGTGEYASYASRYLSITKTLRAIVTNAAFWGHDHSLPSIIRAAIRVAHDPSAVQRQSGVVLNDCFRVVPAMAVIYAACLGYVAADDLLSAAKLLYQTKVSDRNGICVLKLVARIAEPRCAQSACTQLPASIITSHANAFDSQLAVRFTGFGEYRN